jgi:hypothetical protein
MGEGYGFQRRGRSQGTIGISVLGPLSILRPKRIRLTTIGRFWGCTQRPNSRLVNSLAVEDVYEAVSENVGPLHKLEIFVYLTQRVGTS